MGEGIFIFLIIIGVIAMTAVVFGGWLLVTILRGFGHVFMAIFGLSPRLRWSRHGHATQYCLRDSCRAANPPAARFCRRCGKQLPASG